MGTGTTDHGNNQRGMRETPALELDMFRFCVRIFGAECGCNGGTGSEPRFTFEHDEAPRRELAVVRHSASDGQKLVDFGSGRARGRQFDCFEGTSGGKEFNGFGHGRALNKAREAPRERQPEKSITIKNFGHRTLVPTRGDTTSLRVRPKTQ